MPLLYDPVALKVYTDGSCFNNPGGRGGIAGIVEYPDDLNRPWEPVFQAGYHKTTNNRMELRAVIEALRLIQEMGRQPRVQRAIIFTDSQYVCETAVHAPYWQGGHSVNREGRPIKNRDLWREFLRIRSQIPLRVRIEWAHARTTPILKEVDKLAKRAAEIPTYIDYGFQSGAISRRLTPGKRAATPFPAQSQSVMLRIYRIEFHKAAGNRQHRIIFDLFSPTEGDYVATYFAYVSARMEIHRNHCYEATFNHSRTYPRIVAMAELENCPERREVVSEPVSRPVTASRVTVTQLPTRPA